MGKGSSAGGKNGGSKGGSSSGNKGPGGKPNTTNNKSGPGRDNKPPTGDGGFVKVVYEFPQAICLNAFLQIACILTGPGNARGQRACPHQSEQGLFRRAKADMTAEKNLVKDDPVFSIASHFSAGYPDRQLF